MYKFVNFILKCQTLSFTYNHMFLNQRFYDLIMMCTVLTHIDFFWGCGHKWRRLKYLIFRPLLILSKKTSCKTQNKLFHRSLKNESYIYLKMRIKVLSYDFFFHIFFTRFTYLESQKMYIYYMYMVKKNLFIPFCNIKENFV